MSNYKAEVLCRDRGVFGYTVEQMEYLDRAEKADILAACKMALTKLAKKG